MNNDKGFTLIELLIAIGILGLVLGALGVLFTGMTKSYTSQDEIVTMQENARTALDFVARTLKNALSSSITISGLSCNNSLTFTALEDFGKSTGTNTSNTLNDTAKNWTSNQWQYFNVTIISGTGIGQTVQISSNTATQLNTSSNWTTIPDSTSEYRISSSHTFSRSGNTFQYNRNAGGDSALADNITCFTVQGVGTPLSRVNITITAETTNPRADTGARSDVTFRSSVEMNN